MRQKLGQHFLKNKSILKKIVNFLNLKDGDLIVEVGSGHGELTKEILAFNLKIRVFSIEKDKKLIQNLRSNFSSHDNLSFIEGDAIEIIPKLSSDTNFLNSSWKLTGNIPYYITGRLLRITGELENKPELTILLIQKEVAERIIAKPPKMNLLSATVQIWSEPKILLNVKRDNFSPPPQIDSVVISLSLRKGLFFDFDINSKNSLIRYFKFVRILFKQPRKTILNNLLKGGFEKEKILPLLKNLSLDENLRPQNLSLEKIICLFNKLSFSDF